MRVAHREQPTLYHQCPLDRFLETSPEAARNTIAHRHYPRKEVFTLIESYNRKQGNVDVSIPHDAAFVVTGQQLGFMGGPLYTILKAISAIQIAKAYNAIPLFWLATEDHDIAEIDHCTILDEKGNLTRYRLPFPNDPVSVEDLLITDEHISIFHSFADATNSKVSLKIQPGEKYCDAMVRILVQLFKGTDLLFIEPYVLRPLYRDFLIKEILERDAIRSTLQATTRQIKDAGGVAPIDFPNQTNLFFKNERGHREKLLVDDEKKWVERVETSIDRFTVNVAARPVIQSALIPTLAYVGGPTEIAYYRQLKDYHTYHNVPMPAVLPRISATIITERGAQILSEKHLDPWEDLSSLSGVDKHYMHNLLHPRGRLQERVLNSFGLGVDITRWIQALSWKERGHSYLWNG